MFDLKILSPNEMQEYIQKDILDFDDDVFKRIHYLDAAEYRHELSFVLLDNNKIIACAVLQKNPFSRRNIYWIKYISVDVKYRNMGCAKKLIIAIFEFAKRLKYIVIK